VGTRQASIWMGVHHEDAEMYIFDQKILGIMILLLLSALVVVKQIATGSVLEKPKGIFLVQLVNSFNLFFLLFLNPLVAILLIAHRLEMIDPLRIIVNEHWLLAIWEMAGLVIYVTGYFLMAWALICLDNNYQIGGSIPRTKDAMVMNGPFRLVRHPMYTAALMICFGLASLTQSWALFGVFSLYLIFIFALIPLEEDGLRQVYDRQYFFYQQKTKKFIPFVY
jgi:protein-S-isoprenylcysteine O-methyltransferase Ste14